MNQPELPTNESQPQLPTTQQAVKTPMAIIADAIQSGNLDVEVLERLSTLQIQWEKRGAEKSFNLAMARFQRECPTVVKTREVSGQKMRYSYAGYDDMMRTIRPMMAECGLSVSFSSVSSKDDITVTCTISHEAGHSTQSSFTCPVPNMKVNDTQRMGAASTYAKRYCLQAALNIVVSGEDDDAAALNRQPHENPEANPDAPKTQPRGQRVTAAELERLAAEWQKWAKARNLEDRQHAYKRQDWVAEVTGQPCPKTVGEWTRDNFSKCLAALGVGP